MEANNGAKSLRKAYKDLDFTDDFMFRKILRSNEELCKELVELLLCVRIDHIRYKDDDHDITITPDARGIRLDVYLDDGEGNVFDLEMQKLNRKDLPKRTRYYQSLMDMEHLDAETKNEKLPDSYILFICMFDPYDIGLHKYEFRDLCVQDTSLELGSGTRKVFINAKYKVDAMSDDMRAFLGFLCGEKASSHLTKTIADNVAKAKTNRPWEKEYMQLQEMFSLVEHDARAEGEAEIIRMNEYLLENGRLEDLKRATKDEEFRKRILEEMKL